MQYFSAVDQRVLRLQEIGETVELLEARIGVMLAVRGVTRHFDRDDVLGDVPALNDSNGSALRWHAARYLVGFEVLVEESGLGFGETPQTACFEVERR